MSHLLLVLHELHLLHLLHLELSVHLGSNPWGRHHLHGLHHRHSALREVHLWGIHGSSSHRHAHGHLLASHSLRHEGILRHWGVSWFLGFGQDSSEGILILDLCLLYLRSWSKLSKWIGCLRLGGYRGSWRLGRGLERHGSCRLLECRPVVSWLLLGVLWKRKRCPTAIHSTRGFLHGGLGWIKVQCVKL